MLAFIRRIKHKVSKICFRCIESVVEFTQVDTVFVLFAAASTWIEFAQNVTSTLWTCLAVVCSVHSRHIQSPVTTQVSGLVCLVISIEPGQSSVPYPSLYPASLLLPTITHKHDFKQIFDSSIPWI